MDPIKDPIEKLKMEPFVDIEIGQWTNICNFNEQEATQRVGDAKHSKGHQSSSKKEHNTTSFALVKAVFNIKQWR